MITNKKIKHRIALIIKLLLASIMLFLISFITYFYINRDKIKQEVFNGINNNLYGEISFDEVHLNLLAQFPSVSLNLVNLKYFDHKQKDRDTSSLPSITLDHLYLKLKLSSLLKETVKINGLHLEDGEVHLVQTSDSVFNLAKIIIPTQKRNNKNNKDPFDLSLNNFSLDQIDLYYADFTNNSNYNAKVNTLSASLQINADSILMKLVSEINIKHIPLKDQFELENKLLSIDSDLTILRSDSTIDLDRMDFILGELMLNFSGHFNYSSQKELDLKYSLANDGLSLTSLFFTKKGYMSIKKGSAYLDGSISHLFNDTIPNIQCNFGLIDIEILVPKTNRIIHDFNIKGHFSSGKEINFSKAILVCDTIYGNSSTGKMNGAFSVRNLLMPEIKMLMDMKIDLNHYEELFKLDFLNNTKGNITLHANIDIQKKQTQTWIPLKESKIDIKIENVSFDVPDLSDNNDYSSLTELLYYNEIAKTQQGNVLLDGMITHTFADTFPVMNISYQMNDFEIYIPKVNQNIKAFNLSGTFNSGESDDFSEAVLTGNNLGLEFGESFLKGAFTCENLVKPKVNLDIDAKLNLKDVSHIIPDSLLSNVSGEVDIQANYNGGKLTDSTWIIPSSEELSIRLNKVSCLIVPVNANTYLNGNIIGTYDSLNIKDLDIEAGNTKVLLNGDVINVSSLFNDYKNIQLRNSKVHADCFDLPQFIQWLPNTPPGFVDRFKYKIKDADINVNAAFSKDKNEEDKTKPFIFVDVSSGSGMLDSLLPPFDIGGIQMNVSKYNTTKCINFPSLEILFENGTMSGDLFIYANVLKHDSLKTNLLFKDMNPGELFSYYKPDSLQAKDTQTINGDFNIFMEYDRLDDFRKFETLSLNLENLEYINPKDTIACDNFLMHISNVTYNNKAKPSLLASLSANSTLEIVNLSAKYGYLNSLSTKIIASNGEFSLSDLKTRSLLQNGKGNFVYSPFAKNPSLTLDYTLNNFAFDELFERINKKTLVKGNVNADLRLSALCSSRSELLQTLNGSFLLNAEQLLLMGIDLDQVMRKISRTQNFNFVDLAGVLVAGPLGLVVTKGADATSILINDYEDSTHIEELITLLKIDRGQVYLNDVAFSTHKNRIAAKGELNLPLSTLEISAAIVDKNGYATWKQNFAGTFKDPKLNELKPIKSIFKPVDNLVKDVFSIDGEVYYKGQVKHPDPTQ